jgi:hypothetical protein
MTNAEALRSVSTLSTNGNEVKLVYTAFAHRAQVNPLACNVAFVIWADVMNAKDSPTSRQHKYFFIIN